MISLEIRNRPPGLNRQLMVSGNVSRTFSTQAIWVKSSRLMMAPSSSAILNSSGGVSLEENMMSWPVKPQAFDSISSVSEEQSVPQPMS